MIINAQDRFGKRETTFWKDYKALSGVLGVNEFLALNYPNTTAGRKERPQAFNPDF